MLIKFFIIQSEMAAIKASDPCIDHAEALKLAGTRWKVMRSLSNISNSESDFLGITLV